MFLFDIVSFVSPFKYSLQQLYLICQPLLQSHRPWVTEILPFDQTISKCKVVMLVVYPFTFKEIPLFVGTETR